MGGYYDAGNAYEPSTDEPYEPVVYPPTYFSITATGLVMSFVASIGGGAVGGLLGILGARNSEAATNINEMVNHYAAVGFYVCAGIGAVATIVGLVSHRQDLRESYKFQQAAEQAAPSSNPPTEKSS